MGNETKTAIDDSLIKEIPLEEDKLAKEREKILKLSELNRPLFDALKISGLVASEVLPFLVDQYTLAVADDDNELATEVARVAHKMFISRDYNSDFFVTALINESRSVLTMLSETNQEGYLGELIFEIQDLIVNKSNSFDAGAVLVGLIDLAKFAQRSSLEFAFESIFDDINSYIFGYIPEEEYKNVYDFLISCDRVDLFLKVFKKNIDSNIFDASSAFKYLIENGYISEVIEELEDVQNPHFLKKIIELLISNGYESEAEVIVSNNNNSFERDLIFAQIKNGADLDKIEDRLGNFSNSLQDVRYLLSVCLDVSNNELFLSIANFYDEKKIFKLAAQIAQDRGQTQVADNIITDHLEYSDLSTEYYQNLVTFVSPIEFFEKMKELNIPKEEIIQKVIEILAHKSDVMSEEDNDYLITGRDVQIAEYKELVSNFLPILLKEIPVNDNKFLYLEILGLFKGLQDKSFVKIILNDLSIEVKISDISSDNVFKNLEIFELFSEYGYDFDSELLLNKVESLVSILGNDQKLLLYSQLLYIFNSNQEKYFEDKVQKSISLLLDSSFDQESDESKTTLHYLLKTGNFDRASMFSQKDILEASTSILSDLLNQNKFDLLIDIYKQVPDLPYAGSYAKRLIKKGQVKYASEIFSYVTEDYMIYEIAMRLLEEGYIEEGMQAADYVEREDFVVYIAEKVSYYSEKKDRASERMFVEYCDKNNLSYHKLIENIIQGGDTAFLIELLEQCVVIATENPKDFRINDLAYSNLLSKVVSFFFDSGEPELAEKYFIIFSKLVENANNDALLLKRLKTKSVVKKNVSIYLRNYQTAEKNNLADQAWKIHTHFSRLKTEYDEKKKNGTLEDGEEQILIDEDLLRQLVIAGITDRMYENFLKIIPKNKRTVYRNNTSKFNEELVLEAYRDLLTTEELKLFDAPEFEGINLSQVFEEWGDSGPEKVATALNNFIVITELERKRKGIVKKLISAKNFNISNFMRYPQEMLLDMFDNMGKKVKIGIVVYAKSDWNGALLQDQIQYKDLRKQLAQKGYMAVFVEAGSARGVLRRIKNVCSIYGEDNKISFLIIEAHGSEKSFSLSKQEDGKMSVDDFLDASKKIIIDKIRKKFYVPLMPWLFNSCSTGAEDGIAQAVTKVHDGFSVGPDNSTSAESMTVNYREDGTIESIVSKYKKSVDTVVYKSNSVFQRYKATMRQAFL